MRPVGGNGWGQWELRDEASGAKGWGQWGLRDGASGG